MTGYAGSDRWPNRWRLIGWGAAAWLLLMPLVAMRFTSEVVWTASDFITVVMVGSIGLAFEAVTRISTIPAYRAGAAIALFTAFATVWTNLAVGMIGSEHDPVNLIYAGVLMVGLAGTIVARLCAAAMAHAMVVTGAAKALTAGATSGY